jgi:hypothetical protein
VVTVEAVVVVVVLVALLLLEQPAVLVEELGGLLLALKPLFLQVALEVERVLVREGQALEVETTFALRQRLAKEGENKLAIRAVVEPH